MVTKDAIESFLSCKTIAIAGVSKSGKKFGNTIFKELKSKGYSVFVINPNAEKINGEIVYPNIYSLPQKPDGLVLVVKPNVTEQIVSDAYISGIKNIWMQQGAESHEAIKFCLENDINVVYRECILMFLEPLAILHRFHRGINKIVGKYPQ